MVAGEGVRVEVHACGLGDCAWKRGCMEVCVPEMGETRHIWGAIFPGLSNTCWDTRSLRKDKRLRGRPAMLFGSMTP